MNKYSSHNPHNQDSNHYKTEPFFLDSKTLKFMIKEVLNAPAKEIILERAHIGVSQFREI